MYNIGNDIKIIFFGGFSEWRKNMQVDLLQSACNRLNRASLFFGACGWRRCSLF